MAEWSQGPICTEVEGVSIDSGELSPLSPGGPTPTLGVRVGCDASRINATEILFPHQCPTSVTRRWKRHQILMASSSGKKIMNLNLSCVLCALSFLLYIITFLVLHQAFWLTQRVVRNIEIHQLHMDSHTHIPGTICPGLRKRGDCRVNRGILSNKVLNPRVAPTQTWQLEQGSGAGGLRELAALQVWRIWSRDSYLEAQTIYPKQLQTWQYLLFPSPRVHYQV